MKVNILKAIIRNLISSNSKVKKIVRIIFMLIFSSLLAEHLYSADVELSCKPFGFSGGGRFTDVEISPHDHQVVLVGSDVAGIFRSENGGNTFDFSSKGLSGFNVSSIAFHPGFRKNVLILADNGLYLSRDNGRSWEKLSEEVYYKERFCSSRLITFAGNKAYVGSDKGIFEIDFDKTPYIARHLGLENVHINALSYYNKLFIATVNGVYTYSDGEWSQLNEGLEGLHITDISSHQDGTIYAVEKDSGLYILENGRWISRPLGLLYLLMDIRNPLRFKAIGVDPKNSKYVLLGTHPERWPSRLFRSIDGGSNWEEVRNFVLDRTAVDLWSQGVNGIESIKFSPKSSNMIFIADWWNLWKSSDYGTSWNPVQNGLQNSVINDIKIDPHGSRRIYLATADNGLMVSEDRGKTWLRKTNGLPDGHAQEVEISKTNPNKLYLILNPWNKERGKIYVYKSIDGGNTWQDISFYGTYYGDNKGYVSFEVTNLEIDPLSDEIIYVASNGYGIYRSTDGGSSWAPIHHNIDVPYVKGPNALIALADGQNTLLYMSTLGGGIFKSKDRGDSWTKIVNRSDFAYGIAYYRDDPRKIVVALAEKKLLVSNDGGKTYSEIILPGSNPNHIASYSVSYSPVNPKIIVVGTLAYDFKEADGIFVSTDGGVSFRKARLPDNIPQVNVNTLSFSADNPEELYVGFNGIGVLKCRLRL